MLEPRQLKAQHYCQLSSLSMEMSRTTKDFGGQHSHGFPSVGPHSFKPRSLEPYPLNLRTISEGTDSGCNLYSVTTGWMLFTCLLSFGGKDYEDHGTIFLCQTEESATLYKHCNRIWPFSFEDWWHIKTNTIATRVKSLQ